MRIRSQIGVIYAVEAGDALFRPSSAATACSTTVPLKGRAWQKEYAIFDGEINDLKSLDEALELGVVKDRGKGLVAL